jgi:hypothetical protein
MAAFGKGPPVEDSFSLVAGGPLYRLLQNVEAFRHHNSAQVVFWIGLTWLPLLGLSLVQGTAWGNKVRIPLLSDPSVFGRFFVALSLLVSAESVIDRFIRQALSIFNSSGIIKEEELPIFRKTLAVIARLRDSKTAELLLATLACIPYYLLFADYEWVANGVSTWHGTASQGLSPAGWWFTCVSSPILRFLMFRWLWRFVLWTYVLGKMRRLNLVLVPTHPDRMGGLGFLLQSQKQFGILAAAMASVIAGQFANEVVYFGKMLNRITAPATLFVVIAIVLVLSPLACFSFKLFSARYDSLLRNNGVARSVSRSFDGKWMRGMGSAAGAMIGTQDPSSMIDYISTYDVIRETSVIPIDKHAVIYVMVLAATPFALLWLLNKPLERLILEILKRLLD